MARGGARVGAGRPKKGEQPQPKPEVEADQEARKLSLSPLEYMLRVMNDDSADDSRRDRMAVAAAPYVHGKAPDVPQGKKEQKQKAAEERAIAGSRFAPPAPPRVVVNNG